MKQYLLYYATVGQAIKAFYNSALPGDREPARLHIKNGDELFIFEGGNLARARLLAGYAFSEIHIDPGVEEPAKQYLHCLKRNVT